MPKVAKPLTAIEVKRINKVGFNAVGTVAGLGLLVSPTNSKSWVFRTSYGGKRHPIGLGGYPAVTLSQAIEKARKIKNDIDSGLDPLGIKRANKSRLLSQKSKARTFEECAELFLRGKVFRNDKHAKQWLSTLKQYAYPYIGKMLVSEIGISDIRSILDPIWFEKTETASRLQGRIKRIIDFSIVSGYRESANPAVWAGYLDTIYDSPKKIKAVSHFDSMPYQKLHEFVLALKKHKSISARALEFLIITVVRSDSVRSATWGQIDFDSKVWTVPREFTKTKKREHTVPLSNQAIELLSELPRFDDCDLIFPTANLKKMSDSAISKLMREMRDRGEFSSNAVPHGFRATFSTWRLEQTTYSKELGEFCLMHEVGDAVYRAYQRSDGLEKRRSIMKDWSNFIYTPLAMSKKANVSSIRRVV